MSETGTGRPLGKNESPLNVLYINPAGGCNLHCRHCWVNEGEGQGPTLPLNLWKDLFHQARELGCSSIKLTGGEPFLYPEIVQLYLYADSIFSNVTIETNGTIIPPGLWETFQSHPPFFVSTSIDSADEDIHDDFRGVSGAWRKTVNFSRKLVEEGINSQVIMSVSTTERKPVSDMVNLVRDLGINTLKVNFITPSGRGDSDNFYRDMEIREVLDFFQWMSDETPLWVMPSVPAALLSVNRLQDLGYCPVRNLLGVLPDGTFSLCGVGFSRSEMAWGRFPERSVEEVWRNSPVLNSIRSSLPDRLEGVCSMCIHRDSCIGRCIVNNNETGGSLVSPDAICQAAWDAGLFPETRLIKR